MSFHTWHYYGYGICTDQIESNTAVEKVKNLLACAPTFRDNVHYMQFWPGGQSETFEFVKDYAAYSPYGFAWLLQEVISEAEGITLHSCDNFDGENFLLYLPCYPWTMQPADVALTEDKIKDIICKYVSILTDVPIDEYQKLINTVHKMDASAFVIVLSIY